MGFVEIIGGAVSAVIVVFLGIVILSAIASATGQDATLGIILLFVLGIAAVAGAIFAIFR
jgi:membrane protein DedA with SNARE-associated domain